MNCMKGDMGKKDMSIEMMADRKELGKNTCCANFTKRKIKTGRKR